MAKWYRAQIQLVRTAARSPRDSPRGAFRPEPARTLSEHLERRDDSQNHPRGSQRGAVSARTRRYGSRHRAFCDGAAVHPRRLRHNLRREVTARRPGTTVATLLASLILAGLAVVNVHAQEAVARRMKPTPAPTPVPFSNPELVTINGYNQDAEEPFISRDGKYLFFDNSNA